MNNYDKSFNDISWTDDSNSWIQRAANSYSDRMRVDNFSKTGNQMFQDIVKNAILGHVVYFLMLPNGREAKVEDVPVSDSVAVKVGSDSAEQDDSSGDGEKQKTPVTRHVVTSGIDPVPARSVINNTEVDNLIASVGYTTYSGRCFTSDNEELKGLYALRFLNHPITGSARAIANRAEIFDRMVLKYMRDMLVPEKYISGTENNVKIENRDGTQSRNSHEGEATIIPVTESRGSTIVPKYDILSQWDNEKSFDFLRFTAAEFVGETKVPPVDFPELGTLNQTAQSLVSNREGFVSRVLSLKAQIETVFDTAGIPELSWLSTFPYTPQDIASIGDAAGKGVDFTTLRNYSDVIA